MLLISDLELAVNLCPGRIEGHSESIASVGVNLVDEVGYAVMYVLVFPEGIAIAILADRVYFRTIFHNMAHVLLLSLQNLTATKYTRLFGHKTLLSVVKDFIHVHGSDFAFIA